MRQRFVRVEGEEGYYYFPVEEFRRNYTKKALYHMSVAGRFPREIREAYPGMEVEGASVVLGYGVCEDGRWEFFRSKYQFLAYVGAER